MVRGETIKYASYKKKERFRALKEIDKKICEMDYDSSLRDSNELRELKIERDEMIKQRTERNMFYSKANWRQNAERGTKYFHDLIRRNRGCFSYESLELEQTAPGTYSSKTKDMLEECVTHFEDRYRFVATRGDDGLNFFC